MVNLVIKDRILKIILTDTIKSSNISELRDRITRIYYKRCDQTVNDRVLGHHRFDEKTRTMHTVTVNSRLYRRQYPKIM